ncbi:MAG: hypothetical protein HUK04_07470 [Bacteroidaceae bacterium]|nr:hypothetical protein [Bacteroidaceae bacterium]
MFEKRKEKVVFTGKVDEAIYWVSLVGIFVVALWCDYTYTTAGGTDEFVGEVQSLGGCFSFFGSWCRALSMLFFVFLLASSLVLSYMSGSFEDFLKSVVKKVILIPFLCMFTLVMLWFSLCEVMFGFVHVL